MEICQIRNKVKFSKDNDLKKRKNIYLNRKEYKKINLKIDDTLFFYDKSTEKITEIIKKSLSEKGYTFISISINKKDLNGLIFKDKKDRIFIVEKSNNKYYLKKDLKNLYFNEKNLDSLIVFLNRNIKKVKKMESIKEKNKTSEDHSKRKLANVQALKEINEKHNKFYNIFKNTKDNLSPKINLNLDDAFFKNNLPIAKNTFKGDQEIDIINNLKEINTNNLNYFNTLNYMIKYLLGYKIVYVNSDIKMYNNYFSTLIFEKELNKTSSFDKSEQKKNYTLYRIDDKFFLKDYSSMNLKETQQFKYFIKKLNYFFAKLKKVDNDNDLQKLFKINFEKIFDKIAKLKDAKRIEIEKKKNEELKKEIEKETEKEIERKIDEQRKKEIKRKTEKKKDLFLLMVKYKEENRKKNLEKLKQENEKRINPKNFIPSIINRPIYLKNKPKNNLTNANFTINNTKNKNKNILINNNDEENTKKIIYKNNNLSLRKSCDYDTYKEYLSANKDTFNNSRSNKL